MCKFGYVLHNNLGKFKQLYPASKAIFRNVLRMTISMHTDMLQIKSNLRMFTISPA